MRIEVPFEPELISGQMVVAGFEGKTLPEEVRRALAEGRLSGVILFGRNLGGPEQVRALTDAVRAAAMFPPLIMIDHEGGRVQRLGPPFTVWPPARALGERGDAALARAMAEAMAAELLAVGINVNLAPVLDVEAEPSGSGIGDRSLGPDPARVAELGAAMIEGMSAAGIISCAKHFPGMGAADLDPHVDLPSVAADRDTLLRRELVPFEAAIAANVPLIMSAHVRARAYDKYYPATLSSRLLTDVLRERMGFGGAIITDDLEMKAIADCMPIADAAYAAVRAGADLLLVASSPARAEAARQAIVAATSAHALDFPVLGFARARIIALKERFLLPPPPPRDLIASTVGCARHRELTRSLG